MKTTILSAFLLILSQSSIAQYQMNNGKVPVDPACNYEYSCFHQYTEKDENLMIREEQEEEVEPATKVKIHNKKIKEVIENSEQPGLNQQ